MPLQDEERTVCALLRSVAQQSRLPDEVILVDAGSRDRTIERAGSVDLPCPLRIVRASRVFPGVARNEGVDVASFEWIAFTDGGIVLHPDWLRELVAASQQSTEVVFGGLEPVCDTFFRECAALAYGPAIGWIRSSGTLHCIEPDPALEVLRCGWVPAVSCGRGSDLRRAAASCGGPGGLRTQGPGPMGDRRELGATFDRFANYSHHNLVAGWGRYWHLGVARLYGLLGLGVLLALLAGAGFWAGLALPLFFVGRATKAAWVKRGSFAFSTLHPGRIVGAAGILVVIDGATAVGVGRWLRSKGCP